MHLRAGRHPPLIQHTTRIAGHTPAGIETPASEDMVGGNDHNLYPSSLALKALATFGKAQQKYGINAESNNGAALPESANRSIRTVVGS